MLQNTIYQFLETRSLPLGADFDEPACIQIQANPNCCRIMCDYEIVIQELMPATAHLAPLDAESA